MKNHMFREAMGKFATGITVVTTEHNNEIHGMTVNALMSISLEPKLIAISIDEKASLHKLLQETNQFGVSILQDNQKELSMVFAKQKEMVDEVEYDYIDTIPVLKQSLVTMACKVQSSVTAGDHMIFIAEVTSLDINEGSPILYYGGQYNTLSN
ncbi:flavin reductase family protein [Aquibacillus rhizosphaerae]|uniref:Flavin reductase family protein n=1 Tax=Aquibacillus rhizosphaerae TaxID=3051431 RepID=A0ABT7L4N6_9BACI|nr:flavin reductase family protein [Aquibacillus sp. LR5S19]MDL4839560.1 flavin reductase family protein [Aquibacillus sp. LR5S19]